MIRKRYISLASRWDIRVCEEAVLNSGDSIEDNLGDADMVDPEDGGLQMPPVDELSDEETAYDSMIKQGVADYTLAEVT